jgi:hypothetical protein
MIYKASSDVYLSANISGSDASRKFFEPTSKEIVCFQCSTKVINAPERNTVVVGERSIRIEDDTISLLGGIEALKRNIESMKNIQVVSFNYIAPPTVKQKVKAKVGRKRKETSVDTQVAV